MRNQCRLCDRTATYDVLAVPGFHKIPACSSHVQEIKEQRIRVGFTVRTEYLFPYFG